MRWRRAFAWTYSAELRAGRRTRAASVVGADPERYRRFTGPAVEAAGIGSLRDTELSLKPVGAGSRRRAERLWAKRRRAGKALSVLRLAKRSEEHTSELQSLMRISYAVFCLKKKKIKKAVYKYSTHNG